MRENNQMTPETEAIPPCRILYRGGLPCDEVITERPKLEVPNQIILDKPETPFLPRVLAVGRPRTRPVKAKPHLGKGHAWSRLESVTVERILELQAEGLTAGQIGERLGCTQDTIFGRLRKLRRSSPEASRMDESLRTCSCGRRKWPTKPRCWYCEKGRKCPI